MNNIELKEYLNDLDSMIDDELPAFFAASSLKSMFSRLVEVIVWNDDSLNKEIIDKLDVLTDNLDSFNFGLVRENIVEILDLLEV